MGRYSVIDRVLGGARSATGPLSGCGLAGAGLRLLLRVPSAPLAARPRRPGPRTARNSRRTGRPASPPSRSYSAGSAQVPRGSSSLLSTPGTATGTSKPKFGSLRNSALLRLPSSAALRSARVSLIGMRLPTPYLPPVQPVLTSQQSTLALGDPLLEQVAVDRRVARHERRAEAGREGRLRLGHADLGARDLGRVARQEVVHRLVGRQPARSAAARRTRRRSASRRSSAAGPCSRPTSSE